MLEKAKRYQRSVLRVSTPKPGIKGNTHNLRHGAYSMLSMRLRGRPSGNTKLGRAFRAVEQQYLADMGGEENATRAERQIANDNAWCDLILATLDYQLESRRQLTRKGKPVAVLELRMRVAAHRRENYRLIGIKRAPPPQQTLEQYIQERYGGSDDEGAEDKR